MPKQTDISEYKDMTIEADIQFVKRLLDDYNTWEDPTHYTIKEYFPQKNDIYYSPTMYDITNLSLEIEDGYVMGNGYLEAEEIMLFDNMMDNGIVHGLNMFVTDDILMIGVRNSIITITFDNYGYIRIAH